MTLGFTVGEVVALGVTMAGTAASAATAGSASDSASAAARKAAAAQRAANIFAANAVTNYNDKATRRLDPYSALGTGAAGQLQNLAFGDPSAIFATPLTIPDHPKRKDFKSLKEFKAAEKTWQGQYDDIRAQAKARGIDMPARNSFRTSATYGTADDGMETVDNFDPAKRNAFISDWNGKQAELAATQKELADAGITNADEYSAYLAQSGQNGPGTLLHNYSLDDYKAQWGADPTQALQPGDFQASPDYQFRQQQGMNAIQGSAAAKGGLLSSATMKALNDYAGQTASDEFNNWFNRDMQNRQMNLGNYYQAANNNRADKTQTMNTLGTLLDSGQRATTAQSNIDMNTGNTIAGLFGQQGQINSDAAITQGMINANKQQGIGQAINSGLSSMVSLAGMYGAGTGGGATTGANSNGVSLPSGWQNSDFNLKTLG